MQFTPSTLRLPRPVILLAVLGLLALPAPATAQSTLRTPSASDAPPCADADCSAGSNSNSAAASADRDNPGDTAARPGQTAADARQVRDRDHDQESGQNRSRRLDDDREPGTESDRNPQPALSKAPTLPEPPPSEFQEFVAASVGRKLPLYGHDLFNVPTSFTPVERVPATADYRIGPGDEILLRVWGQIDLNGRLTVDRGGEVFLPKVGALSVAGLKYQQLPDFFRDAIGRVFRNFDLTVSLGQLRSIAVLVVGQARRPGSYTISALSTLVNALFASGGPLPTGSLRHIQLKRNGQVVTEFDFYDLLLNGDQSKDARLLPGDVIYIPPAGAAIALAGSVNAPAIYELRDENDTSLAAAVAMAGGLATTADGQKVVIERIEQRRTRRLEEFPLDAAGWQRTVKDGDLVRIFSLSPRFENAVTLRGNVAHPGRTEWHAGLRVKDVIPNPEALLTREYWRSHNAIEDNEAPPPEKRPRSAFSSSSSSSSPTSKTTEATTEKLRNQVARSAPEINWDYAVIQRMNPQDLTVQLLPFHLGRLLLQGDEQDNLVLEPGDVITIFSQNDLAVPLERQSKFVRLEGEFRAAGVYQAEPGETVRHLVERVGGLMPSAYLYGAEFTRESARLDQQKGLDRLIEKLEQDVSRNVLSPSGISPEEMIDNRARLQAQRQLVDKLRDVKATGRVVLDLKPDSTQVGDLPEIALEDGDRFVIPFRPATVEMLGAVYNQNSFLYRREARVEDYLERAGGPTRDADRGRMFVIRADGSVLSKQSVRGLWNGGFAALRLMPGDAIVVPERLSRGSLVRGLKDWSQIFSQFALGAAAVRVIQ